MILVMTLEVNRKISSNISQILSNLAAAKVDSAMLQKYVSILLKLVLIGPLKSCHLCDLALNWKATSTKFFQGCLNYLTNLYQIKSE